MNAKKTAPPPKSKNAKCHASSRKTMRAEAEVLPTLRREAPVDAPVLTFNLQQRNTL